MTIGHTIHRFLKLPQQYNIKNNIKKGKVTLKIDVWLQKNNNASLAKAISKDDLAYKDKYLDIRTKIMSQEMPICKKKSLISIFCEYFVINLPNVKLKNIQYQQKDFIARNINLKYENSALTVKNYKQDSSF